MVIIKAGEKAPLDGRDTYEQSVAYRLYSPAKKTGYPYKLDNRHIIISTRLSSGYIQLSSHGSYRSNDLSKI